MAGNGTPLDDNPHWFRDAVIYQLHIRAFRDGDGNGIGDLRGLTEKLDYLATLGVTALWLQPFYPSPLKDDGYDIADYYQVHPDYNTLADFRRFLRAAHARGLRVITELVLNHTSDQHPWFQRARRARPDSVHRNYYVWSDTPERYADARIIFQDFETSNWTWDPLAKAYFWHRFYSHQPDLNFELPQVRREMLRVLDFWFGLGVDGLRLDAVPYLFEREGSNCENLAETHGFLQALRAHVDARFRNRMLLAEANQWPEDAVVYFGKGDECHMAFHFPLMPRMFMALQMEDRFPLVDILEQTPALPAGCQWAIFLRNHDELTLEMVTDEERDYMYRVYAQDPRARINLGIRRRLAPLMGNNRRKIELMNILLFSLPGTPVIYYGDEIGMGDNYFLGDRNGVRTPMQWSPDRNAGFSGTSPQKLYLPIIIEPEYHYESINVENQIRNPSSLLWWMRRVIAMRRRFSAFGRGTLEMVPPENPRVLAFVRRDAEHLLLVVINLSRFSQVAHLDLSGYSGRTPEEVFSRNRFPIIRDSPYVLTLGIHDYFWFVLQPPKEATPATPVPPPSLRCHGHWTSLLQGRPGERFAESVLAPLLIRSRWFRSKGRTLRQVLVYDRVSLPGNEDCLILLLRVLFAEGAPETYLLPLTWRPQTQLPPQLEEAPQSKVAALTVDDQDGILFDAIHDPDFRQKLLGLITRRGTTKGEQGRLAGVPATPARHTSKRREEPIASRVILAEQSNSSLIYGDRYFLKLYRKLEEGPNPDVELNRQLSEKGCFPQIPTYAGRLEYRPADLGEPWAMALLQGFVPNQGDGWQFTLDVLSSELERVLGQREDLASLSPVRVSPLFTDWTALPEPSRELLSAFYLEMATILGRRTAELHQCLSDSEDPAWRPEEFSLLYQRSVFQSMRSLVRQVMTLLSRSLEGLTEPVATQARSVLAAESDLLGRLGRIRSHKISALKCRIHGDFHLGQVLFTGKDFFVIDFEGEPARPLSERRLKRSPLRDVAGMLRSFRYAMQTVLHQHGRSHPGDLPLLQPWGELWTACVGSTFVQAYCTRLGDLRLAPREEADLTLLMEAFLLEKTIYELGYELNSRPEWVGIPLRDLLTYVGSDRPGE